VGIHELANLTDIDVHRTGLDAPPASHTLNAVVVLVHVILEFVHESLPNPMQLGSPRVMSGPVEGEQGIHAAIPVAHAHTRISETFILDVETPAGGTHIGAGAAIDAGKRNILPERGVIEGHGGLVFQMVCLHRRCNPGFGGSF